MQCSRGEKRQLQLLIMTFTQENCQEVECCSLVLSNVEVICCPMPSKYAYPPCHPCSHLKVRARGHATHYADP